MRATNITPEPLPQQKLSSSEPKENDSRPSPPTPLTVEEREFQSTNHSLETMHLDSPQGSLRSGEWPAECGLEGKYANDNTLPGSNSERKGTQNLTRIKDLDIERAPDTEKAPDTDKAANKPSKPKKQKTVYATDQPCIVILDSLNVHGHSRTFTVLREYLQEEANRRLNLDLDLKEIRNVVAGTYQLVPEQPNGYDCGVYLLYYIERFFQDPSHFTAKFLAKEDISGDFSHDDIKAMRDKLKKLIFRLKAEESEGQETHGFSFPSDGKEDDISVLTSSDSQGETRKTVNTDDDDPIEVSSPRTPKIAEPDGIIENNSSSQVVERLPGEPPIPTQQILDQDKGSAVNPDSHANNDTDTSGSNKGGHFGVEITKLPKDATALYTKMTTSPRAVSNSNDSDSTGDSSQDEDVDSKQTESDGAEDVGKDLPKQTPEPEIKSARPRITADYARDTRRSSPSTKQEVIVIESPKTRKHISSPIAGTSNVPKSFFAQLKASATEYTGSALATCKTLSEALQDKNPKDTKHK